MAIKIYNKGGSVVVEDGTEYIQSIFSYYAEGDNITVIDRISDNFVWNLKYDGFLNEAGTAIGSSASAVLDYLGSLTTTEVATIDYNTEVALGKIPGAELWNKFGYNQDIDIGTEVIASWGGTFTPLTTATTLTMSSTSADDDDGGTGCNSIVIYGIDENRNSAIEVLTLNGTTPVVTTSTWLGINRVAMFLCGSGKVNAGLIGVLAVTGGSTMAVMPAGGGVTQQCIFHVPAGYSFLAEWLLINVLNRAKNAELTIKMWVYSAVSNGNQEVFSLDIDTQNTTGEIELNPNLPFPISEKTVIWLECTSDTNDITVNARFSGILQLN